MSMIYFPHRPYHGGGEASPSSAKKQKRANPKVALFHGAPTRIMYEPALCQGSTRYGAKKYFKLSNTT